MLRTAMFNGMIVAVAATMGLAGPAMAQTPADPGNATGDQTVATTGTRFSVGLGAAVGPDYEGSNDYAVLPAISLRVGEIAGPDTYVQINGTTLRSNLLRNDHWRLGVSGRYLADYNDVDDSRVQDLKGVDQAVLLGLTVGYDFIIEPGRDAVIELDGQYDVLEGNGGTVTPRFRYGMTFASKIRAEASVSASWASQDYMSERFGIDDNEAAESGLDDFDADEGFKNVGVGLTLTYPLSRALAVTGFGSYNRMLNDAGDSPIVDDRGSKDQLAGGVLLNYSF